MSVSQELRRDVRRYPILMCKGFLDEPRRVLVGFPNERVLKERSEVKLAVHLAITTDVLLVDKSLVAGSVVETNKVAGKGVALNGAVGAPNHRELRLLADRARCRVTVP